MYMHCVIFENVKSKYDAGFNPLGMASEWKGVDTIKMLANICQVMRYAAYEF